MTQVKIYLAGRIHGLTYPQATGWRNELKSYVKVWPVEVLDPMDKSKTLEALDRPINNSETELNGYNPGQIYNDDISAVEKANIIYAYLPWGSGHGTSFEIGYAQGLNKIVPSIPTLSHFFPFKTIIVVGTPDMVGHPFWSKEAGINFFTLKQEEDALSLLKNTVYGLV
jgi:nucleoside 2-deoxyribosyltransferase